MTQANKYVSSIIQSLQEDVMIEDSDHQRTNSISSNEATKMT